MRHEESDKPCVAWNEEMAFVAAEPFEDPAVLIVEARAQPGKNEIVGHAVLPLPIFDKHLYRGSIHAQWFSLEPFGHPLRRPEATFARRVHLRACLEGAYHVMDDPTMYAATCARRRGSCGGRLSVCSRSVSSARRASLP